MITCEVCGGVEFEKYAGYMYCLVCQTQSQDIQEQEYEYQEADRVRKTKSDKSNITIKVKEKDDGIYTSWELFNFILYGMTQELRNAFSLPFKFQVLVLKLWACYLKECNVSFISLQKEAFPKLRYNFRARDARVLFNVDVEEILIKKKKQKRKSDVLPKPNTSVTSGCKRSLARKRISLLKNEYKELMATSMTSNSGLENETLESLGKSRIEGIDAKGNDSTETEEFLTKCLKELFNPKDFEMHQKVLTRDKTKTRARDQAKKDIKSLAKNKLLSILHLALVVTGSDVQLSDLLRLIRESHLSYAKVTQFLPKEIKFGKSDITYVDVISDRLMPTHLSQRKITSQLACLLNIKEIEVPDVASLVRRYCNDLNLPDRIADFSEKILLTWVPKYTSPKSKGLFPSYEAWAMVSIIFVLKLLFGLNDRTELFLSDLAKRLNRVKKHDDERGRVFVFEDWQKHIECRKTFLIEFHYPTQEQLDGDALTTPKKFLRYVMKESKDEHRAQRFVRYPKYYLSDDYTGSIRSMLEQLTRPMTLDFTDFEPSLTPQTSYLKTILSNLSEIKAEETGGSDVPEYPKEILNQSFKDDSLDFALDPSVHLVKEEGSEEPQINFGYHSDALNPSLSSPLETSSCDILTNCRSQYWILHGANSADILLSNFKEEILNKTPKNFQWLVKECARMLEMNVRDVYKELISLEKFALSQNENGGLSTHVNWQK